MKNVITPIDQTKYLINQYGLKQGLKLAKKELIDSDNPINREYWSEVIRILQPTETVSFKDYNKISDELNELTSKIEEYEKIDRAEGAELLESDPNYYDLVNIQLNSMRTYRQCLIARQNSIVRGENTTKINSIPEFLYQDEEGIKIGFKPDEIITKEWNDWLKDNIRQ